MPPRIKGPPGLGVPPAGATSEPITTYVVKVASRCNLKCSYCYMYEHVDQSWRDQPAQITAATTSLLGRRIAEYARQRSLASVAIVAHGGEPLLLGASGLRRFFSIIRRELAEAGVEPSFGIQTNGTLVDAEIVRVCQDFDVGVGVSIDGPAEINDRFRVDRAGNGSFHSAMEGVCMLQHPEHGPSVFSGFISVVNARLHPRQVLSFFEDLEAPAANFLLPDYNHDTIASSEIAPGELGAWLSTLFDAWIASRSRVRIRLFGVIRGLLLGATFGTDQFGRLSPALAVVETDGSLHALDVLKTSFHGATATGLSLASSPLSELETVPAVVALSNKAPLAAGKCIDCDLFSVCGGGYLPHRYSEAAGFDRESVYCEDLQILIRHIARHLRGAGQLGPSRVLRSHSDEGAGARG